MARVVPNMNCAIAGAPSSRSSASVPEVPAGDMQTGGGASATGDVDDAGSTGEVVPGYGYGCGGCGWDDKECLAIGGDHEEVRIGVRATQTRGQLLSASFTPVGYPSKPA